MSSPPAPKRPGRLRLTLGRKAGALFLLLAVVLVGLAAQGIVQLVQVGLDARRFLEESREARVAHEMQASIEQLQLVARIDRNLPDPTTTGTLLGLVRSDLELLSASEPGDDDPSTQQHESAEQAIFGELRVGLDGLEDAFHAGRGLQGDLLWQVEEAASDVRAATDEEADDATRDLEARVGRLIRVMAATALFAVAILVVLYVLVRRHVVQPVQTLSRGARLFGSGDLDHRIRISSSDEIGELAHEFNHMADSLTETQRDLERRVRERTAEFIRAARLADLGAFAAGIAHEVNTPLASIASCAEGLERRVRSASASTDEQVEYLQTIAHEAYRAHDITARLLAFARKDPGPTAPLDVRQSIRNVARLLDHDLRQRGLRLLVETDPDAPLVSSNGAEMEQLLLNLLKNASDASPAGGCVWLRCRGRGSELVLEVEDEGPGVPDEHRDRIFDPFFTTKRPGEGTGLGLSLVFRIVESHEGTVEVERGAAGGALFRVALPAAPAHPEEAA